MRARERELRRRDVRSSGTSDNEFRLDFLERGCCCVGETGTDRFESWDGGTESYEGVLAMAGTRP